MGKLSTGLLAAALLCVLLRECQGTTCTAEANYCMDTLRVTSTCTSDECVCQSPDTYVPVVTGCAVAPNLGQPIVRGTDGANHGAFSGEVFVDAMNEDLMLYCETPYDTTGTDVTFRWESDGNVMAETGQVYTQAAIQVTTDIGVICQYTVDGFTSQPSEAFNIVGLATAATTISRTATITGGQANVLADTDVTLSCMNRPAGDGVGYGWTVNGADVSNDDAPLVVNSDNFNSEDIICLLTKPAGGASAPYTEPAAAIAGTAITAVEIISPSTGGSIEFGQAQVVSCRISAPDVHYTGDGGGTWAWTIDGAAAAGTGISGETTPDLTLPTDLNIGSHDIGCVAIWTTNTVTSETITINVVAADQFEAILDIIPGNPATGGYMSLRCSVFASSLEGFTYSWMYDGNIIVGQTDNTLQINNLADADHGAGNNYECIVSSSYIAKTDTTAVTIANLAGTTPTIDVVADAAVTNYGTGDSYTLRCDPVVYSRGMTFTWMRAGDEVSGQTGQLLEITATADAVIYNCQASLGAVDSQMSSDFTVDGQDIVSVALIGPTQPVIGSTVTLTCDVTTGAGASGSLTYSIDKDGTEMSTTSSYTITDVSAANANGDWTCTATINGAPENDVLTLTASATPAQPIITTPGAAVEEFNNGGTYTLNCFSESHDSSAVYEWIRSSGGVDTTLDSTSSALTISSAAATDAGTYTCQLTINGQDSVVSLGYVVTYGAERGQACTAANFATDCGDESVYTGNCIGGRCECAEGVALQQDSCSNDTEDGAGTVVASALTILGAWLVSNMLL